MSGHPVDGIVSKPSPFGVAQQATTIAAAPTPPIPNPRPTNAPRSWLTARGQGSCLCAAQCPCGLRVGPGPAPARPRPGPVPSRSRSRFNGLWLTLWDVVSDDTDTAGPVSGQNGHNTRTVSDPGYRV